MKGTLGGALSFCHQPLTANCSISTNNMFPKKKKIVRKVLIIVENLPLPFDRRVWQEATTLQQAGYEVSIISPTGKGYDKRYEQIQGVHIYRYPLPVEGSGALGYALEYSLALFW